MNCETFQKLKKFEKQNPGGLENVTERQLEQWYYQNKEAAEDVVDDCGGTDSVFDGILCI